MGYFLFNSMHEIKTINGGCSSIDSRLKLGKETSLTRACLCLHVSRWVFGEPRRTRARRRIADLVSNYVVMKINRYICTTVASLWAFSLPLSLHPYLRRDGRKRILPFSSFFSFRGKHGFFGFCHATCLILSKVHPAIYLSISAFLRFPSASEAASWTEFNLRSRIPCPPLSARYIPLEQSIPISRESLLNLASSASRPRTASPGVFMTREIRPTKLGSPYNGTSFTQNFN